MADNRAKQSHTDDDLIAAAAAQFHAARRSERKPPSESSDLVDARIASTDSGRTPLHAESVAGYELLQERHRGGQGVVYEAFQRSTKRKVAVKFLYEGAIAGSSTRRRFEREIEILSQLRHTNIVTIHDSGEVDGRFFYVMDLVSGQHLDRWFEHRRQKEAADSSSVRSTVTTDPRYVARLFVKICDAVNAAHLRGVIHRDLKPGNILIDGAGEPHVLDFGLAKFTLGTPDDPSALDDLTQTGQFVGSLPWSSPEQTSKNTDDVDTRTDVYALGLLIYHALTGRFPYRVNAGVADAIEQIRTADPQPLNQALAQTCAERGLSATARAVDDELETIVRRCLQKDRDRRYANAGELGRDLQRYLNHEPIEAKRDSIAYLFRKRMRRYRISIAAVTLIAIASAAGLLFSLHFWRQAEDARDRLAAALHLANDSREDAERRRQDAETVTRLLERMFGTDKSVFIGADITVRDVLDGFGEDELAAIADRPTVENHIRAALATAYYNLGDFDKAEVHSKRALELAATVDGENSATFTIARRNAALLLAARGQYAESVVQLRSILALSREIPDLPAEFWLETESQMAMDLAALGKGDEAHEIFVRLLEAARALPEPPVDLCGRILRHLGWDDYEHGKLDQAIAQLRESADLLRAGGALTRQSLLPTLSDLATVLGTSAKPEDAIPAFEEAITAFRAANGERSPRLATALNNYALLLRRLGRLDDAEARLREATAIRTAVLPPTHPEIAQSQNNLGDMLEARKDYARAAEQYRLALATLLLSLPPSHPNAMIVRANVARMCVALDQLDEAAEQYEQLIAIRREIDAGGASLSVALIQLAAVRNLQSRYAEAESLGRESLAIREKLLPPTSWVLANTRSVLGDALLGLDRVDEAAAMLIPAGAIISADPEAPPARKRESLERLIRLYDRQGDAQAAALARTALEALPSQ